MNNNIAIYRTAYGFSSEAFIKEQALALKKYKPTIWTRDKVGNNYNVDKLPVLTIANPERLSRSLFTAFGCLKKDVKDFPLPALVHAHFGPDAAVILPWVKKHKVPLVATFHGFDAQQDRLHLLKSRVPTNLLFILRERQLYKRASRIIAVSEYLRQRIIKRGCPAEKVITHYIGVDIELFKPKMMNRNQYAIAHIGRHVGCKGVDTLLRALALLVDRWPKVKLYQIGTGPETLKLKKMASDLRIEPNIEWCGAVSHKDVEAILNGVSLYVHPSRLDNVNQTEALGISILEAQAVGLPVVATRTGGIPEAVEDGRSGFLVPENDHKAIADCVEKMFVNKNLLLEIGLKARRSVENKFNIVRQTEKLEAIYDEVLAGSFR